MKHYCILNIYISIDKILNNIFSIIININTFSGFHGHCLMLGDFAALCRVVWIFGNIRRFNPHAGVVLKGIWWWLNGIHLNKRIVFTSVYIFSFFFFCYLCCFLNFIWFIFHGTLCRWNCKSQMKMHFIIFLQRVTDENAIYQYFLLNCAEPRHRKQFM